MAGSSGLLLRSISVIDGKANDFKSLRLLLHKFAKRHKGPLIASSLITCSLVAGLIASLWQADRARFEAKRAKEAEQVAINAAVEALEEREKARKQKEIAEEQERVSEKRS